MRPLWRHNPVKAVWESGGVGVFEGRHAIAVVHCHTNHLPVHQVGGGFDDVEAARRAGEGEAALGARVSQPPHLAGVAQPGASKRINHLLGSFDELAGQGRVGDLRLDLVLEGAQLIGRGDQIAPFNGRQCARQRRHQRL